MIYIYDANGFPDLADFGENTLSFGQKNKRNAFIVYENYPAETLFLSPNDQKPNGTRIAELMEVYNPKGPREFGINEVVAAFHGVKPDNTKITYKSGDQFVTPQRSGSCTCNSLKELVEHEFVMQRIKADNDNSEDTKNKGKAEYRQFKTFGKLMTLVAYYEAYKTTQDVNKQEAMRNQLILAAKDLLKFTEGNKPNKSYEDTAQLYTIKWTAFDILKTLKIDQANFE